ncbi:helix-turn-helix transcriptional regulator [Clostridiaceae bacterium HSG29]|nr:helix-turn-helix transcriptional regulator [Clostridiaceae bacterium HSG29]
MKRLKKLREERRITQNELGEKIGVSGRSIGFYENGTRTPKLKIAIKIANYFEKNVVDVFSESSSENVKGEKHEK